MNTAKFDNGLEWVTSKHVLRKNENKNPHHRSIGSHECEHQNLKVNREELQKLLLLLWYKHISQFVFLKKNYFQYVLHQFGKTSGTHMKVIRRLLGWCYLASTVLFCFSDGLALFIQHPRGHALFAASTKERCKIYP